ncbi:di-heme oxidoredictase family protein [Pseudomonas sp. GD03944]|uniref:di-heme oxidoreductase family protein n=1 Tax=Pseudomonas sp. GD03944 TaxID=2975409 RepID=UPI00244AC99D|nr:di-heme oxidoredictase family protein [Pseudomonas sp. GD03944]MDH1262179.1 c-type cytochrome [Pseudomonas sp. GD03944]
MSPLLRRLFPLLALALVACDQQPRFTAAEPGEARSGGAATSRVFDHNAFSMPSANLSPSRRLDFSVGNSFFRNPWVIAPATTTARDGLGPLFNTNACQNCHIKDGRGHPPEPDAINAVSMLVRLSLPASAEQARIVERLGVVPEPTYGTQLQDMANPGVPPEGKVRLRYSTHTETFADGHAVELRRPELQLSQLGYGPLHPDTLFSLRIAPPMIGLGLLEAISEADILANADPDDANGDGIAGRPNRVWDDALQKTVLGRFGWKAGQPTVNQQNAHAFASDMGLTTSLLPSDQCTEAQRECRAAPHGGEPEVSDNILATVLFYSRNLAVPARRDVDDKQVLEGKSLFFQAGCQGCHTPQFTTASDAAEPELANQVIRPYTDLLLHDMGEGLADGRPEFLASGRQWRTPALWGIGLTETVNGHTQFLHDGRARNLLEAILWHGGEAQAAKDRVLRFNADERAALLAFLNSL